MTTIISRRGFLRVGCCTLGAIGAGAMLSKLGLINALASATGYQALVCIFLFGGNDSNNTLVPVDSRYATYNTLRANLALAENTLLPITALDGTPYGLHPSLTEIQSLYNQKAAALVMNVGTLVQPITRQQYLSNIVAVPNSLFSHADQQIQWQSSIPQAFNSTSGWGGRAADALKANGVAIGALPTGVSTAGNDLFLAGQSTTPATVVPGAPLGFQHPDSTRDAALQSLLGFNTGFSLVQAANSSMTDGIAIAGVLNRAFAGAPPLGVTFPNTQLGDQLKQIAQIIQVRAQLNASRQIFFAGIGDFDTHSGQLDRQGPLLQEVSQAIDAFYAATVDLGVDSAVTTFTSSDFSRTFQPNSRDGSDHAWGSHQLVVGGAVKGGDLYGSYPELALNAGDDAVDRGIWIPSTSVDQYGATLASWFGIGAADLTTVFPNLGNFSSKSLGFMS
jgi:uncharacterized protein (DUF1501 family)